LLVVVAAEMLTVAAAEEVLVVLELQQGYLFLVLLIQ
jgi:hypothetical protein